MIKNKRFILVVIMMTPLIFRAFSPVTCRYRPFAQMLAVNLSLSRSLVYFAFFSVFFW